MKSIFTNIILISLLLFLLACAGESKQADSSNAEYESIPTESAKKVVIFNTKTDQLTDDQIKAFKARAKQKVNDFFDYVKIISDPKVEEDFKVHSLDLANDLFVNDTSTIKDTILLGNKVLIIDDYLNDVKNSKNKVVIIPKKIVFNKDFVADTSGQYSSIVETKFIAKGKVLSKKLQVFLIETDKKIGDTTEKTIEVKLGNIY